MVRGSWSVIRGQLSKTNYVPRIVYYELGIDRLHPTDVLLCWKKARTSWFLPQGLLRTLKPGFQGLYDSGAACPFLLCPASLTSAQALVAPAVSRNIARLMGIARRPLNMPRWAIVIAVAVLCMWRISDWPATTRSSLRGLLWLSDGAGYDHWEGVLRGAAAAGGTGKAQDAAFPVDGTANQLDSAGCFRSADSALRQAIAAT